MPADILLYAIIAAGLVFWLKSILGTTDDDEPSRPTPIFDEEDNRAAENNVVSLEALSGMPVILPRNVKIDNKTTENRLDDISKKYPGFNVSHFGQNVESAFTMIIEAFADGDLETLEDLLAEPVYSAFKKSIEERESKGEKVETTVQAVEKADIIEADLKDNHLYLTVRFTAREICVIRDQKDEIISGDPDKSTIMVDVWVFGRDLESDTPEWHLYETRDDEVEDHKTPVPDSKKD